MMGLFPLYESGGSIDFAMIVNQAYGVPGLPSHNLKFQPSSVHCPAVIGVFHFLPFLFPVLTLLCPFLPPLRPKHLHTAAALPATATATATATSTSAAISTAISTATGLAGERGTGVTIRNAIRHVLRREDRWRRRGGLIVFQALLNKRMRRTITSAANTTITTAPATTPTNTTPNITTATLPASAVRHKTSKIEASLETNATTTTKTNTNTKTINGNHGRTDDFSDDLPEHFSEECSGGGGVLGGGATPPVSKIGKYEEERGRGKHASGAMEANERDRLLGALVGLMDLSWGREFLFRQIVMRL